MGYFTLQSQSAVTTSTKTENNGLSFFKLHILIFSHKTKEKVVLKPICSLKSILTKYIVTMAL